MLTELVLRFVGGLQALLGIGWGAIVLGSLGETDGTPGDVIGWIAWVAGGLLVVVMIVAAMRVALGEHGTTGRTMAELGGTLLVGAGGALLMAAAAAS